MRLFSKPKLSVVLSQSKELKLANSTSVSEEDGHGHGHVPETPPLYYK